MNGRLSAPARLVLQPFHGQIRDEQERDDVERVGHGVFEDVARYVHEFFHSWLLYPNRRAQVDSLQHGQDERKTGHSCTSHVERKTGAGCTRHAERKTRPGCTKSSL